MPATREQIAGLLWGTAVGDALGLPAENLPPQRIKRRWPQRWQHHFIFGKGMTSDDTEHTFLVAQALLISRNQAAVFQAALAAKFRWWFLALPAGMGMATARACLRLWLGISPAKSGVYSAGNGPAMRSAIIGAWFADDERKRSEFNAASARLTHSDERAEIAALAVAEAAALLVNGRSNSDDLIGRLELLSSQADWLQLCQGLRAALTAGVSVQSYADSLGLERGVTGYALHTVPVALFAVWRHDGDFRTALSSVLDCGGDTDSVGAIVGGLAGLRAGTKGIPEDWKANICEWPRTSRVMDGLASKLTAHDTMPVKWFWPGVPIRNLFFLFIVLVHGLGRLLYFAK